MHLRLRLPAVVRVALGKGYARLQDAERLLAEDRLGPPIEGSMASAAADAGRFRDIPSPDRGSVPSWPVRMDVWDRVRPMIEGNEHRTWILMPGRQDAFAPKVVGTFQEAVAGAVGHSAYWQTTTQVREYHEERAPIDRVGTPWAEVRIPTGSPLRG